MLMEDICYLPTFCQGLRTLESANLKFKKPEGKMTHIHCKITGHGKIPACGALIKPVYVSEEPFLFWIVDSDCGRLI